MDEHTLIVHQRQLEREQTRWIQEALKRADVGHVVEHARVKEMAAKWCGIVESKLNQVVATDGTEARITWSEIVVSRLQHFCEQFKLIWRLYDHPPCDDAPETGELFLWHVISAVELIACCPRVGRSGLVKGTREWATGFYDPTIAYRILAGEVQILGILVSHRKWPLMKSAPSPWHYRSNLS
jgi:hypothetical protein